jgi:hypothetical protein
VGALDPLGVEVVEERADAAADLHGRQRPVPLTQQDQGDEGGRGGRRHRVDARGHGEGDLLELGRPLARVGQGGAQRQRLADADHDPPEVGALGPQVAGQPGEPLRLLGAPLLLLRHRGDLVQLLVDEGDGDEHRVSGRLEVEPVDQVAQDPVAGLAQLAGTRPSALHEPLQVEPLRHQVGEVVADHQLVDVVAAEGPADEHDAGALAEGTEGPEGEVGAAEGVVAGQVVVQQDVGEDEGVDVATVGGQEDQGVASVQLAEAGERVVVGVDVPGVGVQRSQQRAPQLDRDGGLHGDQLLERVRGVPAHHLGRLAQVRGQLVQVGPEARLVEDLLGDQPGDLVAAAEGLPLGPVERHEGLAPDEGGEADVAVAAVAVVEPGVELRAGRGLRRGDLRRIGARAGQQLLQGSPRPPWLREEQDLAERQPVPAGTGLGQPGDPNRRDGHVVGEAAPLAQHLIEVVDVDDPLPRVRGRGPALDELALGRRADVGDNERGRRPAWGLGHGVGP